MKESYLLFHIEWFRCYNHSIESNLILNNSSLLTLRIHKNGGIESDDLKEINKKLSVQLKKVDFIKIGQLNGKKLYFYNYKLGKDANEDEDGFLNDLPPIIEKFNNGGHLKINLKSKIIDEMTNEAIELLYVFLKKFGRNIWDSFTKVLI